MTTKPPSATAQFAQDSLEAIAYRSVQGIPARETNDLNRLGYSVWAWLKERKGTLEEAVMNSGVRTDLSIPEVSARVREKLKQEDISF